MRSERRRPSPRLRRKCLKARKLREMLVTTNTYPVKKTPATTRSLSSLGTCQWILWQIIISTEWNNLTLVVDRLAQISWCAWVGGDNFRCYNLIPRSLILSNQGSVVTSEFWSSLDAPCRPAWADVTQRAGADINWCTPASRLDCPQLRLSFHLQVLVPPVPLLKSYDGMQKEPSAMACDIANLVPPDLWGYVHGFGYYNFQ